MRSADNFWQSCWTWNLSLLFPKEMMSSLPLNPSVQLHDSALHPLCPSSHWSACMNLHWWTCIRLGSLWEVSCGMPLIRFLIHRFVTRSFNEAIFYWSLSVASWAEPLILWCFPYAKCILTPCVTWLWNAAPWKITMQCSCIMFVAMAFVI